MTLRFASLGSGSAGNATIVSDGETHLLVDCGFSARETQKRLLKLGLSIESISAVLITHEHSDHIKGVPILARRYALPIFLTPGTYQAKSWGEIPKLHFISADQPFHVGSIIIQPVSVPHDAAEPVQYIFQKNDIRLGILTDLGSYTQHIIDQYSKCQGLLLEANHDTQMLSMGSYPMSLKRRVGGQWGHLSNAQTARLLAELDLSLLQHLIIGHMSLKNNSIERATDALTTLSVSPSSIRFADQEEGFEWVELF